MRNFISKVNPLQGTASDREYSTGNTLPIAARPFGMHHWSLQTAAGPWFFHPAHRRVRGIPGMKTTERWAPGMSGPRWAYILTAPEKTNTQGLRRSREPSRRSQSEANANKGGRLLAFTNDGQRDVIDEAFKE